MGCTGPDVDADEKAADEDKMLRQAFAKNGMQAEKQELEQGSFLFLPLLSPTISPLSQHHLQKFNAQKCI